MTRRPRQLEEAARRRAGGYEMIPPALLAVTVRVAADVVGVSATAIDTAARSTAPVMRARRVRDQLLFEAGYRESAIGQATGRPARSVAYSLATLEEQAERGSLEFRHVERARQLVPVRLRYAVRR